MYILTVIPIARGVFAETLSYFSSEDIPLGSIVFVPIRNREVPALVTVVTKASREKAIIKSSDYALRKLSRIKPKKIFTDAFLRAAELTSRAHAEGLGETIKALIPKVILEGYLDGVLTPPKEHATKKQANFFAIQSDIKMRLEEWKRFVRESFVRHESVFICLPTEEEVERVSTELKRGIENYTFVFHGSITKKRLLAECQKTALEKHAVLVIGTPQYLTIPRFFATIILDEEHVRSWKMFIRPMLDFRIFAEAYALAQGARLIFGAPILRPETHRRIASGEIGTFGRIDSRARKDLKTAIIDPREEEKQMRETSDKRTFQILSKKIREILGEASKQNEKVFLLVARKGLAPITSCADCGTIVRCGVCDAPLVIHYIKGVKTSEEKSEPDPDTRIFSCHSCGFIRRPEEGPHETCRVCGGWRLVPLGIGIERVIEEVAVLFPDIPRFVLDGDHAKTRVQARKIADSFEHSLKENVLGKKSGAILIGTPMATTYLPPVEHSIIISIDSLFAIPDFRMNERVFALILALREKSSRSVSVQTRMSDPTVISQALEGELAQFTENELALRKHFGYPPYGTIIKIVLKGSRAEIPEKMNRLKEFLRNYAPTIFPTMTRGERGLFRMHAILKLSEGVFPNEILQAKLRTLPREFTVEVNPDHLL